MRKLTEEVEKLPQLEMYPERKQVFNIISKEQDDGLVKLADCLCNQYKQFYIKMHTLKFSNSVGTISYVALHLG